MAALVKLVVLNGAGRGTLREVCLTAVTWPGVASFSKMAVARASSVNRSSLWTAPKLCPPESSSTLTTQNGSETKARRSFSRSATSTRVGVWTRPTLRNWLPSREVASDTNRVSVAPQMRSMSCRASPARASGSDRWSRWEKARLISPGVRAEKRARRTVRDQLGVLFHRQVERLQPDELALAVEVGGDDEGRGVDGQLLDRPHHRLGGLGLDQRSVDERLGLHLAPLRVLRREVHLHHVALETDARDVSGPRRR